MHSDDEDGRTVPVLIVSFKRRIVRLSRRLEALEGRTADQAATPALPEEMDYPALRIAEDAYFAALDEGHELLDQFLDVRAHDESKRWVALGFGGDELEEVYLRK